MSIRLLRPGLLTTVQDLGRWGKQRYGVVVGGAMDPVALRSANLLVGNDEGAAALEMTLLGPTLRFEQDAVVALCGAEFLATVDEVALPTWRPVFIKKEVSWRAALPLPVVADTWRLQGESMFP